MRNSATLKIDLSLGSKAPIWEGGGGRGTCDEHQKRGKKSVTNLTAFDFSLCFAAKYHNGRLWQVDMKIPRRNVGMPGVGQSAPIRDRNSLWPGGIIPYTIAYSIRKLVSS